jgi:hypothetical protein
MLGSRKRVQLKSVADRLRLDSTVPVIQYVLHFRNPRSGQRSGMNPAACPFN